MIKAIEYEILRGVSSDGRARIPMDRKPVRVATLMDESDFLSDQVLRHRQNVFFEDRIHDWDWHDGQFRYYSRVAEVADVVIVYAAENVGDASTESAKD